MKKSYRIPLILTLVLVGSSMAPPLEKGPHHQELSTDSLLQNVALTRSNLAKIVNSNTDVLQTFDHFIKELESSYRRGEGFVENDVYQILKAIHFAAYNTQDLTQKNREKTPYIIHLLNNAHELLQVGKVQNSTILIASLLQDILEEKKATFEEISDLFGLQTALYVLEVTQDRSLLPGERREGQVLLAKERSAGASMMIMADKICHLKDLEKSPPEGWEQAKVDHYFRWSKAVVDNLPWVNAPLKSSFDLLIKEHWKNMEQNL